MMPTVEIEGDVFTLTEDEKAEMDRLVEWHIDPLTALQMAAGDFEDIVVVPEKES